MAITSATTEEIFSGNGSQSAFVYTQNTDAVGNVNVAIINTAGFETVLTNVTHFDLSGVGGSGGITVTYPRASVAPVPPYDVALTASEKIAIWIAPELTSTFGPQNNDTYSPTALGARVDYIYRNLQKLSADINRAYHVPIGSSQPAGGIIPAGDQGIQGIQGIDGPQGIQGTSTRTMLADVTASADSTLDLVAVDWPATYDYVYIEVLGVKPSLDHRFRIKYLDGATPLTADTTRIGETFSGLPVGSNETRIVETGQGWGTSADSTMYVGTGEYICGTALFNHFDSGKLAGHGKYSYIESDFDFTVSSEMTYRLNVAPVAPVTHDGFSLDFGGGATITGTARLWGCTRT